MKCCIVGAGATGGHLGVKLALAGHEVSVLARGATLAAIRQNGLALEQDGTLHAQVRASDDPRELGPQQLVFVTTKATALAEIAPQLPPLVDAATSVAFLQNGMAWWYPLGLPAGKPQPPQLPVFALAGAFLGCLRADQVIGGILYSANEVLAPGVVRNNSPQRNLIELAAVDDSEHPAVLQARAMLQQAGIASPACADIRANLWLKLVGNAAASSLSVATGNPGALVRDEAVQAVYVRMLKECLAVAAAHGYDVGERFDLGSWLRHRSSHKPSMLQDYEAGRAMEIGEIVLAPRAFARAAGLDTPTLDAVSAIVARLAADRGLFTPA